MRLVGWPAHRVSSLVRFVDSGWWEEVVDEVPVELDPAEMRGSGRGIYDLADGELLFVACREYSGGTVVGGYVVERGHCSAVVRSSDDRQSGHLLSGPFGVDSRTSTGLIGGVVLATTGAPMSSSGSSSGA